MDNAMRDALDLRLPNLTTAANIPLQCPWRKAMGVSPRYNKSNAWETPTAFSKDKSNDFHSVGNP